MKNDRLTVSGGKLQRMWRPIVAFTLTILLSLMIVGKTFGFAENLDNEILINFFTLFSIIIGLLVGGRSGEKMVSKFRGKEDESPNTNNDTPPDVLP